ncbi:MAG: hypothetical protein AAF544_13505, partial [Bacteroidota bacterium]
GPYDASEGLVLMNSGNGEFASASVQLPLAGQVRDIEWIESGGQPYLLVGRNSAAIQVLELEQYEVVQ